jgi:hypothetical protein
MLRKLSLFTLELTGYLILCGIIAVLMGAPLMWTLLAMVLLIDVGVIVFLCGASRPPAVRRVALRPRRLGNTLT